MLPEPCAGEEHRSGKNFRNAGSQHVMWGGVGGCAGVGLTICARDPWPTGDQWEFAHGFLPFGVVPALIRLAWWLKGTCLRARGRWTREWTDDRDRY